MLATLRASVTGNREHVPPSIEDIVALVKTKRVIDGLFDISPSSLQPRTCTEMFAARWPTPFAAVRRAAAPAKLRSQVLPHLPSSPLRSNLFVGRTVCSTTTATRTAHSTSFLYSYRLAIALALPTGALTLGALGGSAPHKPVLECASAERAYATAAAPTRAYILVSMEPSS